MYVLFYICARARVCVRVRACVRACVCVCVCASYVVIVLGYDCNLKHFIYMSYAELSYV